MLAKERPVSFCPDWSKCVAMALFIVIEFIQQVPYQCITL
jgi:hypothetical protein